MEQDCNITMSHMMTCEYCRKYYNRYIAKRVGSFRSEKKAKASRENGKKGGRPKREEC